MANQLYLIANSITSTKNNEVFMVNTAKGGFMVRKNQLEKRGIEVKDSYKFPETTVAVIRTHKKGDYLFPENGGIATQDSTRMHPVGHVDEGKPLYVKGDKPVWDSEGASVVSFVGFNEYKAQLELERLQTA